MHKTYKVFLAAVISSISLLLLVGSASGQFENRVKLVDKVKNKSTGSSRVKRSVGVTRVETRVVTKVDKVKVSSLSVTTVPGASVVLESTGPKPLKIPLVASLTGTAIFEDVKPGKYKVLSSKDDFQPAESPVITIAPQKAHGIDLDLKELTYSLKIQTNLTDGTVQFFQAVETGKGAGGAIQSKQSGNYCVVKIQPNGEAVIADLKRGYYDVDIIPASLEYAVEEAGIRIPEDLVQDEFQLDLEKNISREEFNTAWIQAEWNVPAGWRLERGMKVRTEGIALPKNERYRQYVDFETIANVKLNDSGTVGLILRAKNEKNYYLLQISGDQGVEKNIASLRAVKDGILQPEPLSSASIPHFAKTLASKSGFRLTVQGDSKGFTVWIEDSETGKGGPVGLLTDQYNTYKKGAVGIAGLGKSDFDISFFRVCASKCK